MCPDNWGSSDKAPWIWVLERLVELILNAKTLAPSHKTSIFMDPGLPARLSVYF